MNKSNSPFFDLQKTAAPAETLDLATNNIGRELSHLEQKVITLLHDKYRIRSKYRFLNDEDTDLINYETNDEAGIIELTEDYACAFKSESVSSDESGYRFSKIAGRMYQELFVCGAQPVASLVAFSFGTSQDEINKAIECVGSYNNVYGVPLVGGGTHFYPSDHQPVGIDFMTIGLIDKESRLVSGNDKGSPVYLIHTPDHKEKGAHSEAFACRTLYELVNELRYEGIFLTARSIAYGGILEACIDLTITGNKGIELIADPVAKESDHFQDLLNYTPNTIMVVIRNEQSENMERLCRKWNKQYTRIGQIIDEHKLSIHYKGKKVTDLGISVLSSIKANPSEIVIGRNTPNITSSYPSVEVPEPAEYPEVSRFLLSTPNLTSTRWIYEQFDSTVGTNNLGTNFISDASVIQIKGSRHALALSYCSSAYDLQKYPEAAGIIVAEAIRKVICAGGVPQAITGCLSSKGTNDDYLMAVNNKIAIACKNLGIASSGVSINKNGTHKEQVTTNSLSIGSIAFLNDKHQQMTMSFKSKGDMIYLLGRSVDDLNSSEYVRTYHKIAETPPPYFDMTEEVKLLRVAKKIIARRLVKSAHSVTRGGLFMALLESAIIRGFGFDITTDDEMRKDIFLFGESSSRIVVSVSTARETDFIDFMMEAEVPFLALGHVTREEIRIDDNSFGFIGDYKKQYLKRD